MWYRSDLLISLITFGCAWSPGKVAACILKNVLVTPSEINIDHGISLDGSMIFVGVKRVLTLRQVCYMGNLSIENTTLVLQNDKRPYSSTVLGSA